MALTLVGAFKGLSVSSPSTAFLRGSGAGTAIAASLRALGLRLMIQMAHKKGAGSTKNGRDSKAQRLGVKIHGDQLAKPGGAGAIIIRQRGAKD